MTGPGDMVTRWESDPESCLATGQLSQQGGKGEGYKAELCPTPQPDHI